VRKNYTPNSNDSCSQVNALLPQHEMKTYLLTTASTRSVQGHTELFPLTTLCYLELIN